MLSEILLRKTTAAQAVEVYNELEVFSLMELVDIDLEVLSDILQPIGLFRTRAENIRAIAEKITLDGITALEDEEYLRELPGVGQYITNSVLCYAYGIPKPGLDSNMIRVLTRVFAYEHQTARARDDKEFWKFAETLVPSNKCREYNWGIIDLSAQLCRPKKPECGSCLINMMCKYNLKK